MKKMSIRKPAGRFFATMSILAAFCATLVSFTAWKGGDYFEIYINNKLVLQQVLHADKSVKQISLEQANYKDQLKIVYSECGRVGQDRKITIRDMQNRVLKQWSFADGSGNSKTMVCKVKDIMDLQKGNLVLRIVYSSKELPKGQVLASVVTTGGNKANP